ncbi:hypothetical protein [Streptomyces tsukubensis]|uniref:WD40 repeat domain-containing protein n=1 Tax=Streptomyces tsukubensis TaxID=83656 RepID=A0A1V4A1C6_9ACTN|nr:hypothetical protein [Streptomyces tsukubensis]OON72356.1 hypothetical protein B1H18_30240 [Streptomyces tsukubensis]QFR94160.1 WD40 repeat domain-containing protein [Streptomyces tsukubensis]
MRSRPLPSPARLAPGGLGVVGALAAALLFLLGSAPLAAAADSHEGFTIKDPRITESSGLAASRAHPGVYWTHNDSDDGPYVYAVDSRTGRTVATVTLSGIGSPRDVEAISIGPDNQIYVGDIGDNLGGTWPHVWIYRFPEPKRLGDQTVRATQFTVQYEGGPRNAEALMVHPKTGRVYIASKKEKGGELYEGPNTLSASGTNIFKKVSGIDLWVTDGAFSPDGRQLSLRGYFGGESYAWNDGHPKAQGRISVPLQRQGESMTYTPDGTTLMYGSEGVNSQVEPMAVENAPKPSGSTGSSDGQNGGASGSGAGSDSDPNYKMVAIALACGIAVIFGLKRLLRRK